MLSEHLLIAVLFSASILPLLAVWGRVVIPRRIGLIGMLAIWLGFPLAVVVTSFANREPSTDEEQVAYRPIAVESDGYVGSDSCRSCICCFFQTATRCIMMQPTSLAGKSPVAHEFVFATNSFNCMAALF